MSNLRKRSANGFVYSPIKFKRSRQLKYEAKWLTLSCQDLFRENELDEMQANEIREELKRLELKVCLRLLHRTFTAYCSLC